MPSDLTFPLSHGGLAGRAARLRGFSTFAALAEHVRALPYGRPADAENLLSVLEAGCGTCSSKHRLLAAAAQECGHSEVQLVVGIYEMSEKNTPGVGATLEAASLDSIPEAHCYLKVRGTRHDFTGLGSGACSPFESLLLERVVSPQALPEEKPKLHRQVMQSWASDRGLELSCAWAIREACIKALIHAMN